MFRCVTSSHLLHGFALLVLSRGSRRSTAAKNCRKPRSLQASSMRAGGCRQDAATCWVDGGLARTEAQAQWTRSPDYANAPPKKRCVMEFVGRRLPSAVKPAYSRLGTRISHALLWSQAVDCCSSGAAASQAWSMSCWAKPCRRSTFSSTSAAESLCTCA